MTNERRNELLKVVLAQVDKGNKIPSAILFCSSEPEDRKQITRTLEACIPLLDNGRRAATSAAEYDRMIGATLPAVRMTWIRRAIKRTNTLIGKEKEKAMLEKMR